MKADIFVFIRIGAFLCLVNLQRARGFQRRFACWGSFGPPVVSAQCPRDTSIHISRAGLKVQKAGGQCQYSDDDCGCEFNEMGCQMPNVGELCVGKPACRLDVTQQYINTDKCRGFSDYMYIEFDCLPLPRSVHDVCTDVHLESSSGFLRTPNFPHKFPEDVTCTCTLSPSPKRDLMITMVDSKLEGVTCEADTLEMTYKGGATSLCQKKHGVTESAGSGPVTIRLKTGKGKGVGGFLIKYEGEGNSSVAVTCAPNSGTYLKGLKAWVPPAIDDLFGLTGVESKNSESDPIGVKPSPIAEKQLPPNQRFYEVPTIRPKGGGNSLPKKELLPPPRPQPSLPEIEPKDKQSLSRRVLPKIELKGVHRVSDAPDMDGPPFSRGGIRSKVLAKETAGDGVEEPIEPFPKRPMSRKGAVLPQPIKKQRTIEITRAPYLPLGEEGHGLRSQPSRPRAPIRNRRPKLSARHNEPIPVSIRRETDDDNDSARGTIKPLVLLEPTQPAGKTGLRDPKKHMIRHRIGAPVEIIPSRPPTPEGREQPNSKPWWFQFTAKTKKPQIDVFAPTEPLTTPVTEGPGQRGNRQGWMGPEPPDKTSPSSGSDRRPPPATPVAPEHRDHRNRLPGRNPGKSPSSSPSKHENYSQFPDTYSSKEYEYPVDFDQFLDRSEEAESSASSTRETDLSTSDGDINYDYDPIPLHTDDSRELTRKPFITAHDPVPLDKETEQQNNKHDKTPFRSALDPIPLHENVNRKRKVKFRKTKVPFRFDKEQREKVDKGRDDDYYIYDENDDDDDDDDDNKIVNARDDDKNKYNLAIGRRRNYHRTDDDRQSRREKIRRKKYHTNEPRLGRDSEYRSEKSGGRISRKDFEERVIKPHIEPVDEFVDLRTDDERKSDKIDTLRRNHRLKTSKWGRFDSDEAENGDKDSDSRGIGDDRDGGRAEGASEEVARGQGYVSKEGRATSEERLGNEEKTARKEKGRKEGKKNTHIQNQDGISEKESTMVTIIAGGVIGGIVLIVVIGVVVRFIIHRSNPAHVLRKQHKRECVIRKHGQKMMMARKKAGWSNGYP